MPTGIPDQLMGFSPFIARPCVAVLVGAGVSKGFGLRLMGGEDYESLRSEFQDHLKSAECDAILDHVRLSGPGEPNLEDVFEQIILISASAETLRTCASGCQLAEKASLAATMIGDFVAKRYRFPKEQYADVVTSLYGQLLEAIWSATYHNVLPIFTTNYDLAVESFWLAQRDQYELVRGFEAPGTSEWDAIRLHAILPSPLKRTIVLMKLHGSTGWMLNDASGHQEIVALPLSVQELLDFVQQHAIVAPMRNKAPDRDPYLTYFAYLEECAANAEGLIVLGYAFNELGVRNAIRTGLSRRQGLPLHVLVVDINPPDPIAKLKRLAPPNTIVPAELMHDFGSGDLSQLGTKVERWVVESVSIGMSPRSRVWGAHESAPAGMVSATNDNWVIEWADNALFDTLGYWEWLLPTGVTEFTVSFEMCAERVGRGWYPGVQLVDASGAENIVALVLARGGSQVHSTGGHGDLALATVPGKDGWKSVSPWGSGIRGGEWIPAALEVLGHQYRGVVRGDDQHPCPWLGLQGDPRLLRIGAFGEDTVAQHARCLLRNLHFRRGVEKL